MVTDQQRAQVLYMVKQGHWQVYEQMRVPCVRAIRFRALLDLLKDRQPVDNLHHAPCCPANHWHRARLVFQGCTCGASQEMREGASRPRKLQPAIRAACEKRGVQ